MNAVASHTDPDAMVIYQAHLDAMSLALMAGNFAPFKRRVAYPLKVRTLSDVFIIEDATRLQEMFDEMHACISADGITDFIRIATNARFETPDVIIGSHKSHKMRGGFRAAQPYNNQLRLVRGPHGEWCETHSANAIENKAGKFGIPVSAGETVQAPALL